MYDEYSQIYDGSGVATICTYSSKRITSYKQVPYGECSIASGKDDDNHMFVRCAACDEYMDFSGSGYKCPSCGAKVRSDTPYNCVSRDVLKGADRWEKKYGEPYPW